MKNSPNVSTQIEVFAAVLAGAFFMPWLSVFGVSYSGYQLGASGHFVAVWFIPVGAVATIWLSMRGISNGIAGVVTGLVPLFVISYFSMSVMRGFSFVLGGHEYQTRSIDSQIFFNSVGSHVSIGGWATLAAGVLLLITPLVAGGEQQSRANGMAGKFAISGAVCLAIFIYARS